MKSTDKASGNVEEIKMMEGQIAEAINKRMEWLLTISPDGLGAYLRKLEPEIRDNCDEIEELIRQDFGIKPNPDKVIEFLYDEVEPLSGEVDLDELIRLYAKWRRKKHYSAEPWAELYSLLVTGGYITGSSAEVFGSAIKYKVLPPGEKKVQWLKGKGDCNYLRERLHFTVKQLNDCFRSYDGTPFRKNNTYTIDRTLKKAFDSVKA